MLTPTCYYRPRRPRAQLLAALLAEAASYIPPRGLRPIVAPANRYVNSGQRTACRRGADHLVWLLAGDGIARRIARQHTGRAQ